MTSIDVQVDIWMVALSKTLASCGGYIAGSPATLVDYLRCMAGAFVFSVGMPPLIAASAAKALEIMRREPGAGDQASAQRGLFSRLCAEKRFCTGRYGLRNGGVPDRGWRFVFIPAVILSQKLFQRGIKNVQPVLYPAVPAKSSRLRFSPRHAYRGRNQNGDRCDGVGTGENPRKHGYAKNS